MFKINEHLAAAVYLNEREIPLNAVNSLQSIHISSASNIRLPVMVLCMDDQLNSMTQLGLTDGSPIALSLRGLVNADRKFRVHAIHRQPSGIGFSYTLECYWDSPMYWMGTTSSGIRGSSAFAIASIAAKCGLNFWEKNAKTSDTMLWTPRNQPYSEFARDIARHGYAGVTSHMAYGVDSLGTVRYVDLNANPTPLYEVGYLPSATRSFQIIDFEPTIRSGTNNMIGGYSHTRIVQSLVGQDSEESQIQYNSDSQLPLLNQNVRDGAQRMGISYSPVDFGNVHPKYERAKYQNTRFDLLNSLDGNFLFGYQVPFEIFDNFKHVAPSDYGNTSYDGEYTVKAKVIYIAGTSYHEKIVAAKNGLEK